jgi:hypothetical protein
LTPEDPTVKAIPGWAQQLQRSGPKAAAAAAAAATAATPPGAGHEEGGSGSGGACVALRGASVVQSATGLAEAVARDASVWCGGTRELLEDEKIRGRS